MIKKARAQQAGFEKTHLLSSQLNLLGVLMKSKNLVSPDP
jgi:hypothetical protein